MLPKSSLSLTEHKMGFLPQLPWLFKGILLLLSPIQTQTMPFLALFSPTVTLLLAFMASQVHSLFHFFLTRMQGLKNAHQDKSPQKRQEKPAQQPDSQLSHKRWLPIHPYCNASSPGLPESLLFHILSPLGGM